MRRVLLLVTVAAMMAASAATAFALPPSPILPPNPIHGYSVATAATQLYLLPPNPIRGETVSSVATRIAPTEPCNDDPLGEGGVCPMPSP